MCPRVTFNNFQNEAQQRYGTESTVQWWILPIGGYWNKKYAFLAKEFKTVLSRYADSLENRTKKRSEKISVWKYRHRKHHIAERHEPIRGDEVRKKHILMCPRVTSQQFSKRGATALRHRVHRTVVNSTNWWLLKQKICVFGQRIQDCAVSLCRFAGKSD